MGDFVKVAEISDLEPESVSLVELGEKDLALVFTGTELFALDGTCPHAQCLVAFGFVEGYSLYCGCHGAEFDVRTGQPKNLVTTQPLATYPVQVEGNDIFIALM